ncbi:hypothetical protein GCM10027596_26010 [Nocardioides korecus]
MAGETRSGRFITLDTVPRETPAEAATSLTEGVLSLTVLLGRPVDGGGGGGGGGGGAGSMVAVGSRCRMKRVKADTGSAAVMS